MLVLIKILRIELLVPLNQEVRTDYPKYNFISYLRLELSITPKITLKRIEKRLNTVVSMAIQTKNYFISSMNIEKNNNLGAKYFMNGN